MKRWKDLLPFKRSTQIDGIRYGFGPQRPQQVLLRFASLRWKYPIQEARGIARICHDSPLSVGDVIASKAARCKDLLPFKGSTQMASAGRSKAGAGAVEMKNLNASEEISNPRYFQGSRLKVLRCCRDLPQCHLL